VSAVGTQVPTSGYFLNGARAIGRWLAEEGEAPRRVAGHPFDVTRIESAVARAAREVAHTEPRLPASVAAAVADAIALPGLTEPVTVEEIHDLVEAQLNAAGLALSR